MILGYIINRYFVGNKAKGRISKRVFQENKISQSKPVPTTYQFEAKNCKNKNGMNDYLSEISYLR